MNCNSTLLIGKIEDQGDRVLLYADGDDVYHVIAEPEQGKDIKIGDSVQYDPIGANFGWFVSKK